MKTDALDIDADGLPLFRPDPAVALDSINVATALGWNRRRWSWKTLAGLACGKEVRR
jgi:hypothetical protein